MQTFMEKHGVIFEPSTGVLIWGSFKAVISGDYVAEMLDELLSSVTGSANYVQLLRRAKPEDFSSQIRITTQDHAQELANFRRRVKEALRESGIPLTIVAIPKKGFRLEVTGKMG